MNKLIITQAIVSKGYENAPAIKFNAKACYKVNQLVLVNLDILDEYLETFHIVDESFYK